MYISFKASIEGGTIKSVTSEDGTPTLTNGTYVTEITKNGTYTFTIVGTVDGEDYETTYTMEVKKYALRAGLNVGDYINYEPDQGTEENPIVYSSTKLSEAITGHTGNTADITQDDLDWQILKIYDDGSMDVIGSPTTQTIYFKDAEGYNNGVYVMDDICETLYSRGNIKARSVDLEDFEKNLTGPGKTAKATYISNQISALTTGNYITNVNAENNTVTYVKGRSYYPNIYAEENGSGIDTTTVKTNGIKDIDTLKDDNGNPTYDTNSGTSAYKQADSNLTVTYTYYNISINNANYGDASKALSNSNSFWVASRCVNCSSLYAGFGLRYASTSIYGNSMFLSGNSTRSSFNLRLRPLVHLGSEVQIEACTGTNGTGNMHTITQY